MRLRRLGLAALWALTAALTALEALLVWSWLRGVRYVAEFGAAENPYAAEDMEIAGICALALLPLALLGCPVIGVFLLVFANRQQKDNPYLIIIRLEDMEREGEIAAFLRKQVKKMLLKSKTVTGGAGTELIYEIRPVDGDSRFVNTISKMEGVESAVMVSYDGNYAA